MPHEKKKKEKANIQKVFVEMKSFSQIVNIFQKYLSNIHLQISRYLNQSFASTDFFFHPAKHATF